MEKEFRIFGRPASVGLYWTTKGLWHVEESNDSVRQHFLLNVSVMEAIGDGETSGICITILKLMISIGWLGKT